MKKALTLLFLTCFTLFLCAQEQTGHIIGRVHTKTGAPVPYANIGLPSISKGTSSDTTGAFQIREVPAGSYTLQISAVGYTDFKKRIKVQAGQTIRIDATVQNKAHHLEEVVVTGTQQPTSVRNSPVKVEVLNANFLEQSSSSNIMGVVDRVNGLQKQVACGICNTSSIRINGMEGPYTQVLIDDMPIMGALSSVYGLDGIPNSLIDQVEIIKGPASTLYGTQAVGGVINIITKPPEEVPLLSADASLTSHLGKNLDFSTAHLIGKTNTMLSGNVFDRQRYLDFNGDNFSDIARIRRLTLFNKWDIHRPKDRTFTISGKAYYENRSGGVQGWTEADRGSDSVYGESIYTKRVELLGTYDLPVSSQDLRLDFSFSHHDQNSYYGDEAYIAEQSILYGNLVWDKSVQQHQFLFGATSKYDFYDDNTPATKQADIQFIPGLFVQDEYKRGDWRFLGGLRYDYHKEHGHIASPRLNVKWDLADYTSLRLNSGTGFRTVHLFTEDHAALTGSREVVIREKLQPEQSYNTTLNLRHIMNLWKSSATVDMDVFYTYFTNKIIPDYNTDPNKIIYENLDGYSISRGVAVNWKQSFLFPLTVSLGVTYQDVYQVQQTEQAEPLKQPELFSPKLTAVFNISYEWKKIHTKLNYSGNITGPMHLPTYQPPFTRPRISEVYSLQHLRISHEFHHNFEAYAGVKNLLNYRQPNPLIDPEHPYGDHFDTNYIYGPLQPRRFLVGVKWHLDKK